MISVRKAQKADLKAMAGIEAACFPASEACSAQQFEERFAVFGDYFLVLECEGQLIGLIDGMLTNQTTITDSMYADAHLHEPEGAWQSVFGLAVLPEFQHMGFGGLLLMSLIEQARSENRAGVILTCKEALIGFYEGLGFVNQGLSASVHGGSQWYDMQLTF